jgi:GTPase SAR1 family protein
MAEHNLDIFFETSAKTGENVQKVFFEASKKILERKKLMGGMGGAFGREHAKSNINLPDVATNKGKKKKKSCC